jgi:UDP-N-acetylglucosamine 1-carboxyvinyltransferase
LEFTPIFDRIVAGTYITACLMCGGCIQLNNVNQQLYDTLVCNFLKSPCNIQMNNDKMIIEYSNKLDLINCIQTAPFPGFATDMQAIIMALLSKTKGKYVIVENVFETRFSHIDELKKLGADIESIGSVAIINGVDMLHGNDIVANDLRAGAALVLAGLSAEGITTIENINVIERGYHLFDSTLKNLGADILKIG